MENIDNYILDEQTLAEHYKESGNTYGYEAKSKLVEYLKELKAYKEAEEQGLLLKLPCKVGDTVFVLAECEKIPAQLDGTLYGENGGLGTATGYYCPYEDNCPYADCQDCEDCNECKNITSVFEDEVCTIWIEECEIYIETKNCRICSVLGQFVFLTKEAAEQALKRMGE